MILSGQQYHNLRDTVPPEFWEGLPDPRQKKVFIKPNLVTPPTRWDIASTTRVEVVSLVIEKLKDLGCSDITVGDCGFKDQWELTIKLSGYDRLVSKYGIRLIGLQEGFLYHDFTLVRLDHYKSLFGAKISNTVLESDFIINIPKLKVHKMALVTGAIKNMMGVISNKGSMHPSGNSYILHKRLHDLYFLMKDRVKFCVMDGIIGSEYSESYGIPKYAGFLATAVDMSEMDIIASIIMKIPPSLVTYLRYIFESLDTKLEKFFVPPEWSIPFERPLGFK